jgi:putative NADH-flavin reductase
LVAQALERGHEVTAFVRTPSKLQVAHPALRLFQGDVGDGAAVARAVTGTDVVVSALGTLRRFRHDPIVIDGIRHIVAAMSQGGPSRIIYLSGIGVHEARHQTGLLFRVIARSLARGEVTDHEVKEGMIRAGKLEWTLVRPPALTNGPRTGSYRHGPDVRARSLVPKLSRADLADFMLNQLTDRSYIRKAVAVMY